MNLVQQQYGSAGLRAGFRFRPATLPEAGQCGARLVASRVDGCLAELARQLQQQRGLAHLPRPGEELNAPRSRLP